ncbi:hypothetical protein F183_A54920 (plasmid) [Bryobacterales bacterium F-183]|nr:hypothetical protein F183_A54920 [Bryobacterales bacterium F-183]
MEYLHRGGYAVLPLADALRRLGDGTLPPKAVAITFDDGFHDFRVQAFPILKAHSFPATVYQTTYYSDYNRPVFRLICGLMLHRGRGRAYPGKGWNGDPLDLCAPGSVDIELAKLDRFARDNNLSGRDKDALAEQLAGCLGQDWNAILESRVMRLLEPSSIRELAEQGIDFQLHTHRHLTPRAEQAFRKELDDNQARLNEYLGIRPSHFCYPSGVHHRDYPDWLRRWGAESAVTCHFGLARQDHDRMLLPRFLDMNFTTDEEFDAWLTGVVEFLPRRTYQAIEPDAEPSA